MSDSSNPTDGDRLDEVNSFDAVTAYLSIRRATLRRMCHERRISFLKIGDDTVFTRMAVEEFIKSATVQAVGGSDWGRRVALRAGGARFPGV